jgi:bleomycin hydrolase
MPTQSQGKSRKRCREESEVEMDIKKKPTLIQLNYDNAVKLPQLKKLRKEFYKDNYNRVIQNALCSNSLWDVSEVREYMQSRDSHFSHILDPKLIVSNQGLAGTCWLFAVMNVMRHELIRKLQLPYDFELSESYLSFYEKLEKCNHILTKFMTKDQIDSRDLRVQTDLIGGCDDGGFWITCANLIKKYGIIPKSCFKESMHSFDTDELNDILGYKVREFALRLTQEKDLSKRPKMKEDMIGQIYSILAKMLGTPPNVDEKIEWSYMLRLDVNEILERENKRKENEGEFEIYQSKQTLHFTPHEFYKNVIVHDLDDYFRFSNDPRNPYYEYYQSHDRDIVVGGETNGYYNLPMDDLIAMCVASIKGNTPVQIDLDAEKYLHNEELLFDTKCFDHGTVLGLDFNTLNKAERMKTMESWANHAVVLSSYDSIYQCSATCDKKLEREKSGISTICDCEGKEIVTKFRIENSWGRMYSSAINESDDGYYTATIEWFREYVYNCVIHKDFVKKRLQNKYNKARETPVILPENDIMA